MEEIELFPSLKRYLEDQGYTVHSEVKNCDIVAVKEEEFILIEMKTSFSMRLLIQAAKRKELSDSVYIAVPVEGNKNYPGSDPGVNLLLRRLEIGLILIKTYKTKQRIEVVFHPREYTRRTRVKRKAAIIREINGRYAEFNTAGETSGTEKIFAYKQEALRIASTLNKKGVMSPKELREAGCSEKTGEILSKNIYGWFERVKRGVYRLHETGEEALGNYSEIIEEIEKGKTNAARKREEFPPA